MAFAARMVSKAIVPTTASGTADEPRSQTRDSTDETASDPAPSSSLDGTPTVDTRKSDESQKSLRDWLANLNISSPESHGPSNHLLSPDYPLPSEESADPITVRDLPNATPRPTPSPEPTNRPASEGTDLGVIEGLQELGIDDTEEEEEPPSMEQLKAQNPPLPYDVNEEPLPPLPFSDRNYQNALRSGITLARETFDCLNQCEVANKTNTQLYKIRQRAETLQNFDCPASRTIGIVGDSAAGKSSLINSLLHLNLAHKGSHGSAVTAFVTEYRKRTQEHQEPFTIEVEYSTLEELHEQIHELLYDYRLLYNPELGEDLSQSSADYRNIEQRSRLALSTLQSIFPDRQETESKYLRGEWGDTSNRTADEIENDLKTLAEGLESPAGATDGRWQSTAADASECRDKVAKFMANGLWPRINIVRIYLSAQVLKTGIVLADLPGFRDVNLARVRKAEQYLLQCDEVFVLANINRVVTDESVKRSVENTVRDRINRNLRVQKSISIVCTHADDIDIAESEDNERKLASLRKTRAAKSALLKAGHAMTSNFKELETKYKYIYISARNAEISRELLKKYENFVGNTNLNVFCVGNRHYEGYGFFDQKSRSMAVQGSGIPDLRKFCHSIVDKAQFRASNHFLGVEIPDLLQSLEVWLAASEQESLPTIPSNCTKDLKLKLLRKVEEFSEEIHRELNNQILIPWKRGEAVFEAKAAKASGEWPSVHPWPTYKALVRNYGTYTSPATKDKVVRWNEQVLQQMNEDLSAGWAAFDTRLVEQGDKLQTSMQQGLASLRSRLQDSDTPQVLISAINLKELELDFLLQESFSSFLQNLREIQHNATGDHTSSLILAKMVPTYRACLTEAGIGCKTMTRMYAAMESRMSRRDIFQYIFRHMKTAVITEINKTKNTLTNQVKTTCASIQQQTDTTTDGEANEASERHPKDLDRLQRSMTFFRNSLRDLQEQAVAVRQQARRLGYIQ